MNFDLPIAWQWIAARLSFGLLPGGNRNRSFQNQIADANASQAGWLKGLMH